MSANRPGMSGNRPEMSANRPGMSANRPRNLIILTLEIELDSGQRETKRSSRSVEAEILSQISEIFLKNLQNNRPDWAFTVINSRVEKE